MRREWRCSACDWSIGWPDSSPIRDVMITEVERNVEEHEASDHGIEAPRPSMVA